MNASSSIAGFLHGQTPNWSCKSCVLPSRIPMPWRPWLLNTGSLTEQLLNLEHTTFSVNVLAQYCAKASSIEQRTLACNNRHVWVREVALTLDDLPVVMARTVVPISSLKGEVRHLLRLGRTPLGGYLFSQQSLKRGDIQVTQCGHNPWQLQWSRRSVFYVHNRPLLVTEGFTSHLLNWL